MKNLTLTSAELKLIKTQRAEAKAIANKEKNKLSIKTKENKSEALVEQEHRLNKLIKEAEHKAIVMKEFESKLDSVRGEKPFTLVSHLEKRTLSNCCYYSFTNAEYKKSVEYLQTDELAIEQVKAYKEGDLSTYDMNNTVLTHLNTQERGVRVYLKAIEYSVEVVTFQTLDFIVPVTKGEWNEKTEKYEQVTTEQPAFTLVYGEKEHGYNTIKGVSVEKADNRNLYYDFYKGNSSWYKEVYTTARKIVNSVRDEINNYDQRVESTNKQKRDTDYQAKKYKEFVAENKSNLDLSQCDSSRLTVKYKNGVTLKLGGGLCSDKQDDFTIFPMNFELPSWYEMNLSVEGQKAFAEFITKFNFQLKK